MNVLLYFPDKSLNISKQILMRRNINNTLKTVSFTHILNNLTIAQARCQVNVTDLSRCVQGNLKCNSQIKLATNN